MTDRAALLALADRCESATGPDRVLDSEISKAAFPRRLIPSPYTDSLDAALTLVPDHCSWDVGNCDPNGSPWACITRGADDYPGKAATAPLALLAAALRARAAEVG